MYFTLVVRAGMYCRCIWTLEHSTPLLSFSREGEIKERGKEEREGEIKGRGEGGNEGGGERGRTEGEIKGGGGGEREKVR